MNKFKNNSFITGIETKEKQDQEQNRLRKKHNLDENIVIVEKNNLVKFSVQTIIRLVKFVAIICILILAYIGLTCMIKPEIRNIYFEWIKETFQYFKILF